MDCQPRHHYGYCYSKITVVTAIILLALVVAELSVAGCQVDDMNSGKWVQTNSREWHFNKPSVWPADTSCWASGDGEQVNSDVNHPVYTIIVGERKTVESLNASARLAGGEAAASIAGPIGAAARASSAGKC